jgi:hypothetical protein
MAVERSPVLKHLHMHAPMRLHRVSATPLRASAGHEETIVIAQ